MFLFDKDGYLKSGIPEEVMKEIVRRYAEQEESRRAVKDLYKTHSSSMLDIAHACIPIQPLPPGALPIYERGPEVGMMVANLEGIKKMELSSFPEVVHYADTDDYGILPTACERGVAKMPQDIKWSSNHSKVTCAQCILVLSEEEQINNLLSMVDLGEEEKVCSTPTASITPTQKQYHAGGMTCKKCNVPNQYVTESNQPDGTYLCWGCKAGF